MDDVLTWRPLIEELDNWKAAGRSARLWLRDDDAVEPTPALERLLDLTGEHRVPLLLAVIPLRMEPGLAPRVAARPDVEVAVHGARHTNHAPPGRRAEEMAPERGRAAIIADLGAARERLIDAFGPAAGDWYVPPWNRISVEVAAWLPELGFKVLSRFGAASPEPPEVQSPLAIEMARSGLIEINTHVDIVDWRDGRRGRSAGWVAAELANELAAARFDGGRAVGVLTHHLAHDAIAWGALADLFAIIRAHSAVRWLAPRELIEGSGAPTAAGGAGS